MAGAVCLYGGLGQVKHSFRSSGDQRNCLKKAELQASLEAREAFFKRQGMIMCGKYQTQNKRLETPERL